MKKKIILGIIILVAIGFAVKKIFLSGGPPRGMGQMPPPMVSVSEIKQKKIIDAKEYIGRVVAKDKVNLVPHVQGYLEKKYFTDGEMVHKGDLLFLIEPEEYEAAVSQAKANIETAKAILWESNKDLERAEELVKKDYISKSEFDKKLALRDKNRASLEAEKAYLKKVSNNLRHTRIYSPIRGKIGDVKITEGNLVGPNMGTLATIVRLNPIYVTYNIAAEEFTKLQLRLEKENRKMDNCKVKLEFPDGTPYSIHGIQDFYDNEVDRTTGTIKVRATFDNPKGILLPGQLVNVIVYEGNADIKTVVPQAAVLEDPQGKYVYFIDRDSKAQQKRIKISGESGKYFIVEDGLTPGDEIILAGIQKIMMPGMKVKIGPPEGMPPSKGQHSARGSRDNEEEKQASEKEKANVQ